MKKTRPLPTPTNSFVHAQRLSPSRAFPKEDNAFQNLIVTTVPQVPRSGMDFAVPAFPNPVHVAIKLPQKGAMPLHLFDVNGGTKNTLIQYL